MKRVRPLVLAVSLATLLSCGRSPDDSAFNYEGTIDGNEVSFEENEKDTSRHTLKVKLTEGGTIDDYETVFYYDGPDHEIVPGSNAYNGNPIYVRIECFGRIPSIVEVTKKPREFCRGISPAQDKIVENAQAEFDRYITTIVDRVSSGREE